MITITFFLPVIIQEFGVTQLISNLLSSIPYGCALFIMMANAIHSDIKKERLVTVVLRYVSFVYILLSTIQIETHYHSMCGSSCIWIGSYCNYDKRWWVSVPTNVFHLHSRVVCLGCEGTLAVNYRDPPFLVLTLSSFFILIIIIFRDRSWRG
jgi:hypothetical protein